MTFSKHNCQEFVRSNMQVTRFNDMCMLSSLSEMLIVLFWVSKAKPAMLYSTGGSRFTETSRTAAFSFCASDFATSQLYIALRQ